MFATPDGQMQQVDIDARVGGRFCVVERRDGNEVEHRGTYVEIDRPRRLAFDFAVPQFSSQTTRITLPLEPRGRGCELTLLHEGVRPGFEERTAQGWKTMLDALAQTLGDDDET